MMRDSNFELLPTVYSDGIVDVLNLGANIAIIYGEFARNGTGLWVKEPILRMIRPVASLINKDGAMARWAAQTSAPSAHGERLHS